MRYYCPICGLIEAEIVESDDGEEIAIYVHEDIFHPEDLMFDEDGRPPC